MDGHDIEDLTPLFPQANLAVPVGDYNFFSQAESPFRASSGEHGPRAGMEALDLNSQAVEFPNLSSYSEFLGGRGMRTLGLRAPRQGGRGGGRGRSMSSGGARGGSMTPGASGLGGRGGSIAVDAACDDGYGGSMSVAAAGGGGHGGGRGGRSGPRGGRRAATRTRSTINVDDEEEALDGDVGPYPFAKMDCDKANWTEHNIKIFCELWVQQKDVGNCFKGTMKPRGYKELAEKYYISTGLKHDKGQFRNRKDQLRVLYCFWVDLQKETGLGLHPDGTVNAPAWWWEKNTKGKPSELKKLRHGAPEYLDEMEIMFQDIIVDGSASYIPGQDNADEEGQGAEDGADEEDWETNEDSPKSSNSRKRSSSTTTRSTATSPDKLKSKSPMVKMMRTLVSSFSNSEEDNRKVVQQVVQEKNKKSHLLAESVKTCQELAIECGAAPDSIEFFACSKIFETEYHRHWFRNIPTPEARLVYLKRWCQANNMY
ncbi:unnamed protein product [Urochloa humidicola]